MLGLLDFLGTVGGNILSLPGILGLALGMMTRSLPIGAVLGGLVGVVETILFAGFDFGKIEMMELIIAILVGVAAGTLGSAIRIKGTTV